MPKPLELALTDQQRQELLWHRDHDQKPYVRERCAALLMIAKASQRSPRGAVTSVSPPQSGYHL